LLRPDHSLRGAFAKHLPRSVIADRLLLDQSSQQQTVDDQVMDAPFNRLTLDLAGVADKRVDGVDMLVREDAHTW